MVEPNMEAAGIEPACRSPRKREPQTRIAPTLQLVASVETHSSAPGRWPNFIAPKGSSLHVIADVLIRIYQQRDALEQGKSTFLYVVREHTGLVKIGVAQDPVVRVKNLQVAHPYPLRLIGTVPTTVALERFIHRQFKNDCVRGEWFGLSRRLHHFLAMLESANEIQADMLANDLEPVDALDTIASLVAPVEDMLLDYRASA